MRRRFYIIILLTIPACNKETPSDQQSLIQLAQLYVLHTLSAANATVNPLNYRANQEKSLQWELAIVQQLSTGPAVIVPIKYNQPLYIATAISGSHLLSLSPLTRLIVFIGKGQPYRYQVNTLIPDSTSLASQFSGIILTEDWFGNSLLKPYRLPTPGKPTKQADALAIIQTCTTIEGYNYSEADPDNGESWSETSCSTYGVEFPDGGVSLGSGDASAAGGGGIGTGAFSIPPPTNPIGNYNDYIKCFTNVGGTDHSYTVTLAVEQPQPGTRTPWVFDNSSTNGIINVGHTFLILTETTAYGSTTRNVGFYPQGIVSPVYPSEQGVLNNDQATGYNISLTISMTNAQFFIILNYLAQGNNPGFMYNLNSNNCTTFALNALASAGINIPTTKGSWAGGSGDDPGDLGEDIRGMKLPANTARNTASTAHSNIGFCE